MKPYETICPSSDTERWLEARQLGIGASEIAAVLGESPWETALQVYLRKLGLAPAFGGNAYTERGNRLESVILEWAAEQIERPVFAAGILLQSTAHPWMLCTLDGETIEPAPIPVYIVEAKWSARPLEWDGSPGGHYHWWQVQQQIAVRGAAGGYLAHWCGRDPREDTVLWIPRCEESIARIIAEGSAFWARIQVEEPPEPVANDAESLAILHPEDDGSSIVLGDAEWLELDEQLCRIKAGEKVLKGRRKALEVRLRAAIGDATEAVLGDGTAYTHKLQHRKAIAATSYRVLRRRGG